MTLSAGGPLRVDPPALDRSATTLRDLALEVQSGRLDRFLLAWADAPRSQPEVADAMRRFIEFADDQYEDAVALLASLSTRVAGAAATYEAANADVDSRMTDFLVHSGYQPADERPK